MPLIPKGSFVEDVGEETEGALETLGELGSSQIDMECVRCFNVVV